MKQTYDLIPDKIVTSEWLLGLLRQDGHDARKIPLGLDLGFFYPRPTECAPRLVVLAMARPRTPRRGFDSVVAALAKVHDVLPSVEIVLFGEHLGGLTLPFPYRAEGVVTDPEHMARLYSEARVHFDGSDFQAFGLPGLEAMGCGAVSVLTDVGGVREFARDQENCVLVAPRDAEAAGAGDPRVARRRCAASAPARRCVRNRPAVLGAACGARDRRRARGDLDVDRAVSVTGGSVGKDTRERRRGRTHVLQILHNEPGELGGTEKFLNALMEALEDECDFSVLYPVQSGFVLQTRWKTAGGDPLVERFLLPGGPRPVTQVRDEFAAAAVVMALDMFDFDAVHVHNLIGLSTSPLSVLAQFDGPVLCSVHDLFLACPNFSLLYRNVEPCGIPDDLSVCDRCLETVATSPLPGSPLIDNLSRDYLIDFRTAVRANLASVDHWVFATRSAADTFMRVYEPEPSRMRVIEHGSVIRLGRRTPEPDPALIYGEPLRVAFVGLGWAKKGLDAVNELADTFRDSSIEIHHFGELKQPASFELHAHGPYDNEFLPELLQRTGVQIVLLPGPYAETFGIVMTEALVAGLPVIGTTYGALGERIRATGAGWTIDPMNVDGIRTLIARLDRARDEVMRATRQVRRLKLETVKDTAPQYAALYDSVQYDSASTTLPGTTATGPTRTGSGGTFER